MPTVKNLSTGARGAYLEGALRMAEPGETIEADDFCDEWFEPVEAKKVDPLDHDGDGKKGGSPDVPAATRRRGRKAAN